MQDLGCSFALKGKTDQDQADAERKTSERKGGNLDYGPKAQAKDIEALRDFLLKLHKAIPCFLRTSTITGLPLDVPELSLGEVCLISRSGRRLPEVAIKLADHAMRSMQAFQA